MKKGLILGASVILLCIGCDGGERTLICTNTQSEEGLKIASTVDMNFKKTYLNNLKFTMEISPESSSMENNWDFIVDAYNKKYAPLEKDGLKVSSSSDSANKKYTIVISADPKKATKEDLDEYGMGDLSGANESYSVVKKDLEDLGYICK